MTTVGRAVLEIVTDQKGLDAGLNSNLSSIKKFGISASGALSSIGVGLGAGAIVAGVKSIVTSVLEYGGEITDLSAKMSVSMDATQRWKYAAEQTGASLEDVSKSVVKLSTNLDGGGKSIKAALAAAGLEFNTIRAMKPEDAFNAVVAAVAKIPDPMTQSRVALELLGKSGVELLPALRDGFNDLSKSATVMSDETIKRLDAASDAWDTFKNNVIIWSGELIGAAIAQSEMTDKQRQQYIALVKNGGDAKAFMDSVTKSNAEAAVQAKANAAETNALAGSFMNATRNMKPQLPVVKELTAEQKAAAKEADRLAAAFQKQVDVLTGKSLAQEVKTLAREVMAAEKAGGLSAFQYAELGKRLDDMRAKGATLTPELQNIWLAHEKLNPSIKVSVNDYGALATAMKGLKNIQFSPPPPMLIPVGINIDVKKIGQQVAALAVPPPFIGLGQRMGNALLGGFNAGLANLGNVIVGAIQGGGNVGQAAFASIGASMGAELGTEVTKSLTKSLGKGLAGAIGGAIGPLGAMLGSAVGGLFDKVFGTAGRDAVKAFAGTFQGGFSGLRQQLNALGDEGERLWIALTQGVGKNNPQQAAAAIKAIEDALARAEKETVDTRNEIIRLTAEIADLERQAVPSLDDMREAAEFFGIEISSLGAAFQQQQLTATATEIWNAFEALRLSGTDMNVILAGASGKFSKLVQDSLKFGTAIPSNMKPVIQSLIDQGLLLDENGNKITDISQIKFGDPVKSEWEIIGEAIDKLTKALDALIKKLEQGVVGAADKARRAFEDWEVPDVPTPGGGSGGGSGGRGGGGTPSPFGFSSFGGATFAMPRVVVPAAAGFGGFATAGMSSAASFTGGRETNITVISKLDGRTVAKNQVKHVPGLVLGMGRA